MANMSSMLKALEGVQSKYDENNRTQMYFRKIPWSDLVVAVREAHQNLQDDTGSTSIAEMEEYLQSRLDCAAYGFPDLTALLEEMHGASIEDGRLSLKAKPPTPGMPQLLQPPPAGGNGAPACASGGRAA